MLNVIQIPVLFDNYVFIIHNNGKGAVIDPAQAEPVLNELQKHDIQLEYIVNTHHHADHIGGNQELQKSTNAQIIAYHGDSNRIPNIDIKVTDGEEVLICGETAQVMYVPGHTLGHIAYYFPLSELLFCGDTLFSMGCGRLFEGSPAQMFDSLGKIAKLPPQTKIYCAHEYTQSNTEFALSIEPNNDNIKKRMQEVTQLRSKNLPTIPSTLELELKTNPFLRAKTSQDFAYIRHKKDLW